MSGSDPEDSADRAEAGPVAEPSRRPLAEEPLPDPRVVRDASGRVLSMQARLGLLPYLTATSLDGDYAAVSERRRAAAAREAALGGAARSGEAPPGGTVGQGGAGSTGGTGGGRPKPRASSLAVLGLFGVLVATAAVQTARNEPVRERSRESLIAQVAERRADLADARAEIAALEQSVTDAQRGLLDTTDAGRSLGERLDLLETTSGAGPATGPGVRIIVDDAEVEGAAEQKVLDTDLQILVNGLWLSGAEAISVNGQRLTNLTAIRVAGEAITVNLQSLSRPYVVTALGDSDRLAARFIESDAGTWWLNLRSVYSLRFSMTSEDSLTVPAAPSLRLRHARVEGAR